MRQPRQTLPLISDEPLIVSVRRSGIEESFHAVDIALVDGDGQVLLGLGDVERVIFPRSAMKPLQAIALVEKINSLADKFYLQPDELSLICASHNGQIMHVEKARELLHRFGLDEGMLACGPHWSTDETVMVEQVRAHERPSHIHNNCSGKHSGMLVLASLLGVPVRGYEKITHPVQQQILGTLEAMTGVDLLHYGHGVDGCGAPALLGPLGNWARGFALFAGGGEIPESRAMACAMLRDGIATAPQLIAGDRRLCSALAAAMGNVITAKVGAEGVYGCAFHELGLGLMMKARDGHNRAVEVALGAVINALGYDIPETLRPYFAPSLVNRAQQIVGDITIRGPLPPAFDTANKAG